MIRTDGKRTIANAPDRILIDQDVYEARIAEARRAGYAEGWADAVSGAPSKVPIEAPYLVRLLTANDPALNA